MQCNTMQKMQKKCNAMQCKNAMQYNTIHSQSFKQLPGNLELLNFRTMQYNAIQCNTMQYNTMQYNAKKCNAKNAMQYNTIQSQSCKQLPGNVERLSFDHQMF